MNNIPKRYKSAVDFVNYNKKSMEDHINSLIERTQRNVEGFELVSASACPAPLFVLGDDEPESGYTIGNAPVDDIEAWVVIIAYKYYDERDIPNCNRGYSDNHYPWEDDDYQSEDE